LLDENKELIKQPSRVARWMKTMGLVAVAKKKFKLTTDSKYHLPGYKNIISRVFSTRAINQKWGDYRHSWMRLPYEVKQKS